jgi:hypothetical protein
MRKNINDKNSPYSGSYNYGNNEKGAKGMSFDGEKYARRYEV